MSELNDILLIINRYFGASAWFAYVLLGVGLFFSLYLGFPQLRLLGRSFRILFRRQGGGEGDISPFRALSTSLSGTVGTGNIGGVALALFIGGPAALFWMWVTAFFGMATRLVEVTLAHKYRIRTEDGTMAGGPMYYMDRALGMKWLAVLFAMATVLSTFGTGNMPQSNSLAVGVESSFGINAVLTGGLLSVLLFLVIIGGIKRISQVASTLVPVMGALYILGALSVLLYNYDRVLPSLGMIFRDAFTGSAAVGGFLGAGFAQAFRFGVARGLFSNEAGQGSSPIAHAAAKIEHSVEEGLVAALGPFIDTIIICTLTGLAILCSGVWTQKFHTNFQGADMHFVAGQYHEEDAPQRRELVRFLNGAPSTVRPYSGLLEVREGRAQDTAITLIHARSFAEEVRYLREDKPYSGVLRIRAGHVESPRGITVQGRSRIHSVALTTKAFSQGFLGRYGGYIVSLSLVLFAFSTTIAWSYYGNRAVYYMLGARYILPYNMLYVLSFFMASFLDTTLIWRLAYVSAALMSLPNLLAIVLLARDMGASMREYLKGSSAAAPPPQSST